MIWRCGCGHRVSRHDEPRHGQRNFYCIPERGIRTFTLRPEDQRKPKIHFSRKAPEGVMKRGDYLEPQEEGDDT